MPAILSNSDRIGALKRLRVQWTTELQQLAATPPDLTLHWAEALADLDVLIARLELSRADEPPASAFSRAVHCRDTDLRLGHVV